MSLMRGMAFEAARESVDIVRDLLPMEPLSSTEPSHPLRWLLPTDVEQVCAVYRDAVLSQAGGLYSESQIEAWSKVPREASFAALLRRGVGWVSCANNDLHTIEAFAVLEPGHRLSLLYCRGRSCRQGRANALLDRLERHARDSGCRELQTEASQLSRQLLQRRGWAIVTQEDVMFAGVAFRRWRMIKPLSRRGSVDG